MARHRYIAWNGTTAALTAAMPSVSTGTSLKTMLQIKNTTNFAVLAWGYSFDTVPTALVQVELITTGTVAATVTAYVSGDIAKYDDSGNAATLATLGTSASGYTSTAEGTITASRLLDMQPAWEQKWQSQSPLDREAGVITGSDVLRIRMTTATAINARCWVLFEE